MEQQWFSIKRFGLYPNSKAGWIAFGLTLFLSFVSLFYFYFYSQILSDTLVLAYPYLLIIWIIAFTLLYVRGERQFWFKASGTLGWLPCTWQGWAVVLLMLATVIFSFTIISFFSSSFFSTLITFMPVSIIIVSLAVWVFYKTGEKPNW